MSLALFVSYALLFFFGAIIGSFLNALTFRFNTGRSLGGRSACMHCGKTISPRDLVPILSYVFLRGRCRSCRARISFQYPAVEFLGGMLAVLCYLVFPDDPLFFTLSVLFWMTLLFIGVYDLRHKVIPDSGSVLLALLALVFVGLRGDLLSLDFFLSSLLPLPLLALSLFSGGRAMGWGDGKLMLGVGWFLGAFKGFVALLFSFWIGMIAAVFLLFPLSGRRGRLTMKSEIPYAPFLIIGAAIAYFTSAADLFSRFILF